MAEGPRRDATGLAIHPDVRDALAGRRPVVALESTIISHGLPYPRNLEIARRVEEIVREEGATPATIAVLGGRITVGLDAGQLEHLARARDVVKVSRRDLARVVTRSLDGATTVAGTMIVAEKAGIEVFVTGGLGGVHRDAHESFDVSADLQELARTPVAVVCAGAKAILDLGRTLEYLETHGVPVLGYRTGRFPAFYSRDSGFDLEQRADTCREIAELVRTHWNLGLKGGVVVANPIPAELELDRETVEETIRRALAEAAGEGIRGKDVTPFLLSRIETLSGGASVRANRALVLHNAAVGGRLAVELASLDALE